jgi:hypothetical protein
MIKSIAIVLIAEVILIALCYAGFKVYKDEPIFPTKEEVVMVSADTLKLETSADPVKTDVSTEALAKTGVSKVIEVTETDWDTLKMPVKVKK